jgi:hypothetical protein
LSSGLAQARAEVLLQPVGQPLDAGIGPVPVGSSDLGHPLQELLIALVSRQGLAQGSAGLRLLQVQHLRVAELGQFAVGVDAPSASSCRRLWRSLCRLAARLLAEGASSRASRCFR